MIGGDFDFAQEIGVKEILAKQNEPWGGSNRIFVRGDLYKEGKISYEDALRNADSVNDLRLMIKLHSKDSKNKDITSGIEHLNIV